LLVLGVVLGIGLLGLSCLASPNPSDDELLARYYDHRAGFDEIADRLLRPDGPDWLDPSSGKCSRRKLGLSTNNDPECARLLQLTRELGSFVTIRIERDRGSVTLTVPPSTISLSGEKGYWYGKAQPPGIMVVTGDLDHLQQKGDYFLRRIEGNWYLYYFNP
jgi:hypothetical protein